MWIEETLEKPKRYAWNSGLKGVYKQSKETGRKISEAKKGKQIPWNKGLKGAHTHSEETRRKISEANKGKHSKKHKNPVRYQGKTYQQWADELGCSPHSVWGHLRKHGHLDNIGKFGPNPNPRTYQGKTRWQWAEELGVTPRNIDYYLKKYGHLDKLVKKVDKTQ